MTTTRGRHLIAGVVAVVGACVLSACGGPAPSSLPVISASTSASEPAASSASTVTADYLPGIPAQLRFPSGNGPAPLVVLAPGGGWASADPTGLMPLAERLTADGATTSLITYRTTDDGSGFPTAVDDVACAVRWSATQAEAAGRDPSHVVVLGHSAGGHLAALAAFSGREFGGDCPYPPVRIDGLIGIAGIYDTDAFAPVLSAWMGSSPSDDPPSWRRVNPVAWLRDDPEQARDVRVLLIHGDSDSTVPIEQTTQFSDELRSAKVDATMTILPGLDHLAVFEADNAEPPIRDWLRSWQ